MISFGSNINFLKNVRNCDDSINSFLRTLQPSEKIHGDYYVDHFVKAQKGYTDGIMDCIGVVIKNSKEGFMVHLSPWQHRSEEMMKEMIAKLQKHIDELKAKGQDCSALMVGGRFNDLISKKLFANIFKTLKKNGIDPSMLCGHRNLTDSSDLFFDVTKNAFGCSGASNLEDLKETYKLVKISSKDKII